MNEELRLDILKNHYKTWIETTNNPLHRRYAEIMYEATLNNRYKEQFNELSSTAVMYQDTKTGKIYTSGKEAAEAKGVAPSTISINYSRYNLQVVKF